MSWIFVVGAVLVAAAGLAYRRRMARIRDTGVTDDVIRRIEASGWAEVDEPLDLEEAAEEEERFWGETWDEPDPL